MPDHVRSAQGRAASAAPGPAALRGLATALTTALLLTACVPGHDDDHERGGPLQLASVPNATEGSSVPMSEIPVGACLNHTEPVDAEHRRRVLPCSSPHRYEVYATARLADPADDERQRVRESVSWCEEELVQRLAAEPSIARSTLLISPMDDYQRGRADRNVACAVAFNDFHQIQQPLIELSTAPANGHGP